MVAIQTSGRPKTVQVDQARAPRVLEHEPKRDTPRGRGSTDRELWSSSLFWLLCESASALGQRGTMAAVIAAVERGGASGSSDFDHHTDLQLGGRWGLKDPHGTPREGTVQRQLRLAEQWGLVAHEHQRVLLAHYLVSNRQIPSTIETRFGELAGVVAWQWCRRQADRRVTGNHGERAALKRRAAALRLRVTRLEETLFVARLACRERPEAFRERARAWFLPVRIQALRDELEREMLVDGGLSRQSDQTSDLQRLVDGCRASEPPGLRAAADKAVRAGHRAWYAAGAPEVEQAPVSVKQARERRVQDFLEEHGL